MDILHFSGGYEYLFFPNGEQIRTGRIWLDNLVCDGSESSIVDCDHQAWGIHNCNSQEDVFVECTVITTTGNNNYYNIW